MQRTAIPYRSTGRFAPIVLDYLDDVPALRDHYVHRPDPNGLRAAMDARRFDPLSRMRLSSTLERQYAGVDITPATRANLDALAREGTLTVTTGHQLCLFGGPLYVPFKILNVIRLARDLSTPYRAVVPVFWMASEDHDRAEIDHAWINGSKVQWPGDAARAVGRMKLNGMDAVLAQVDPLLGAGSNADEFRTILRNCYREDHTLAQATRLFINALFGRFGLVIIDGDDVDLKRSFVPIMQEELLNQVTQRTVSYANAKLEGRYDVQAHAREINLFHLRAGHRSRIEQQGERYQVLDGGPSFSMDELLNELQVHPENFSPNVLLRPLYQETVLPNIAYVGGGGEVAYWMQLRWLFQGMQVPMPVVMLRTSAALLSAKDNNQWESLGFLLQDLFRPADELSAQVARTHTDFSTDLSQERAELQAVYDRTIARLREADITLERAGLAKEQHAMKGLDGLETKLLRAAKRQQEVNLKRMDSVLAHVFPGGALQERRDSIATLFTQQGPALFDVLLDALDPLDPRFSVLVDQ